MASWTQGQGQGVPRSLDSTRYLTPAGARMNRVQAPREPGPFPVELVGAVRRIPDQHEARLTDAAKERVVVV